MINQKEVESASHCLKIALEGKGLKLATSLYDFINPRLYDHEDKYEVIQQSYWMWSELKGELQEYKVGEWTQWYVLEPYVSSRIVYVKKEL